VTRIKTSTKVGDMELLIVALFYFKEIKAFIGKCFSRFWMFSDKTVRGYRNLRDDWQESEVDRHRQRLWRNMEQNTPLPPSHYDVVRAEYIERISQIRRMPIPQIEMDALCKEAERDFYDRIRVL